jgi:hypothetical protein
MPSTHETFSERFPGLEFDWFVQDAEGNIALFSTGGFGPVPSKVQAHFQSHDSAALSIDLPHWGSLDVWKDYARQGLYVFDWVPHAGPYRKMEQPESEMPPALQHLLQIAGLPFFNGVFRFVEGIAIGEGDELTTV